MRRLWIVPLVALLGGVVTLVAAAPDDAPKKPDFRETVQKLTAWVKARKDAKDLAEEPLAEVGALVAALEKMGARELYEGLSPEERKALRDLLDKDDRLDGYADRVAGLSDTLNLPGEDSDVLLGLWTTYQEAWREAGWTDREAREKARKTFEQEVEKRLGRAKAKAILNEIRRTTRRGGR